MSMRMQRKLERQLQVPRWLAVFFLLYAAAVYIYTGRAITNATEVCGVHSECTVYAYNWYPKGDNQCRCLVMTMRDDAPKTFDTWMNPPSAVTKLATLSLGKSLTIVQVINYHLDDLPIEFSNCINMRQL